MKTFFKKTFKIIFIVIISAVLLFGILAITKHFFLTGTPSTSVWMESDPVDTASAGQLVKSDGEDFKILLFADVQLGTNPFKDKQALELMDELVAEVNPDFIMTTGDNSYFVFADFMTSKVIKQLEGYDIPWSTTFGNHDTDGLADRNWLGNQYENAENALFKMGPSNIHGVSNFVIDIVDEAGEDVYSIIVLDSNKDRMYEEGEDYDFIYYDQIKWYEWVVNSQEDTKSMVFFHIPLPEFDTAVTMLEAGELDEIPVFGENHEPVCAPPVNSGLFNKIAELENTTHIFTGHDHVNCLSVNYQGVQLTYGLKTGPTCYYEDGMQGATLITIEDGTNEVEVKHIYK